MPEILKMHPGLAPSQHHSITLSDSKHAGLHLGRALDELVKEGSQGQVLQGDQKILRKSTTGANNPQIVC